MTLITDGFLILASLTACLYCFVLKRRLTGMTDLQEGIGATIAQMASSAEDLQRSFDEAKKSSDEASERASALIDAGGDLAALLSDLVERTEAAKSTLEKHELAVESGNSNGSHPVDPQESTEDSLQESIQ